MCVCELFSLRKLSSNRNSCAMLIVQVLSIATLKWLKATPQHATPLVLPSVRRTCSTRLTPCLLVLQPPSRYSSWCVLQVYCCMVGKGRRPMPTGRRRRLLRLAVSQVCRTVTSWFLFVYEPVVNATVSADAVGVQNVLHLPMCSRRRLCIESNGFHRHRVCRPLPLF